MIGDLLLQWASFTQSGSVSRLRDTVMWSMRSIDSPVAPFTANRWIRAMSHLGHIEVDWPHDRWAVAPAVISQLPYADLRGVLTGARPADLMERLEDGGFAVDSATHVLDEGDVPLPKAVFVQFRDPAQLGAAISEYGVLFGGLAPYALIDAIPRLMRLDHGAPPAAGAEVDVFDLESHEFVRASRLRDEWFDGLYRTSVHGRPQYIVKRGEMWLSCDRSAGVYLELQRRGKRVLRWRAEGENPTCLGTMFVDSWAHLPELAARTLVLCSGLAPIRGHQADTLRYQNVPRELADRLATALHQNPLEIV